MSPAPSEFTRRHFVAAALAGLPALTSSATAQETRTPPAPDKSPAFRQPWVYHFKIGSMDAWSISDCDIAFREGLDLMHPIAARPAMQETMVRHGENTAVLPLYVNLLVVRTGDDIALFDAGFGQNGNPRMGWLRDGLAAIGIKPEQVTAGFLSHAHADHLNGFVHQGKPAFPNATIYLLPEELAFWKSADPDFSKSKRDATKIPGMIKEVRGHFETLAAQLKPVPSGTELLGGRVRIEAAPGHTAGHACFRLRSDGQELLHLMDVAHHHLLMFANPEWNIAFDHDPETAILTRKKYWAETTAQHTRCYGFHLPWPGLGHIIEPTPGQYSWWPERWQWS